MRKCFLILVLTVSLTAVNAEEVRAVNIKPNKIELAPTDIAQAESIQAIRLYSEKESIALVNSSTKITLVSTSYQIKIFSKLNVRQLF
jgi:sensor histidine kinase regulating citrate/malate metabolism